MPKNENTNYGNKLLKNILGLLDNTFDYIFTIISITTVIFAIVLLFDFYNEIYINGFNISKLFEIGLTALISVKFYKVIKDYIGVHKIQLSNLAEIGIVAILSELIFKISAHTTEEILIRILLLVVLMLFYYYEVYFKSKRNYLNSKNSKNLDNEKQKK